MDYIKKAGWVAVAVLVMAGTAVADDVKDRANAAGAKTEAAAQQGGKVVNDTWLTSKTKIALYADSRVAGTKVNVTTKSGVVTLTGKVDTDEAKNAAGEVAKGIDGVKDVHNNLQVVSAANRKVVNAKDDTIQKEVERAIERDAQLRGSKINVRSDAGVVTLSGDAKTWGAAARASEIARFASGVHNVKNNITVQTEN